VEDTLKKLRKKAIKRAMKFLAGERGMATMKAVFKTKRDTDRRLDALYHLAGLPSLTDKAAVAQAIDAQGRRLRSLDKELDELDQALARLEQSAVRRESEPPIVKKPARSVRVTPKAIPPKAVADSPLGKAKPLAAPRPKPKPKAKPQPKARVRATKPKAAAKKTPPPSLPKPKPLGAAKKGKRTAPSKNLLDLNFKKK